MKKARPEPGRLGCRRFASTSRPRHQSAGRQR